MDRLYGPPWNPDPEYGPWEYTVDRGTLGLTHTLRGAEAFIGALFRGENPAEAFEAARQASIDEMHRFESERAAEAFIANVITGYVTRGLGPGKDFIDGFQSTDGDMAERALAGVLNMAANRVHGVMVEDILRELDGLPPAIVNTVVREAVRILGLSGPGISSPFSTDFPDQGPAYLMPNSYAEPVMPYYMAPAPSGLPPPPEAQPFVVPPYYGWEPEPVMPPGLLREPPEVTLRPPGMPMNPFAAAVAAIPMPDYLAPAPPAASATPLRIATRPDANTLLRTQLVVPGYVDQPDEEPETFFDRAAGPFANLRQHPPSAQPSFFRRAGARVTGY